MQYMLYDIEGHFKIAQNEEEYKKWLDTKEWFKSQQEAENYLDEALNKERKKQRKKAEKISGDESE